MDSEDRSDNYEDERFDDFDVMHSLTGAMNLNIIIDGNLKLVICEINC